MKRIDTSSVWGYISTFYDNLTDRSREKMEYFWEGLSALSTEMKNAAQRFIDSTNPEQAQTNPTFKFISLEIDVLKSRPMPIDAANKNSRTVFIPKAIEFATNDNGISQDLVVIGEDIYNAFHSTAINCYIVIATNRVEKYFRILGFVSTPGYRAVQTDGDLSFINKGDKIQARITTGQTYDISPYIVDIPWLRNTVMDDDLDSIKLIRGVDYDIEDSMVRFYKDIIAANVVQDLDSLFCEDVPVVEENLFNSYGSLTKITNWQQYMHDGLGARTSVSAMMKALQNPSNQKDYMMGLSVILGLPLAPDRGVVRGVYESFDYEVVEKNINQIVFAITQAHELHQFIQVGTKMIVGANLVEVDVATVDDRDAWAITLIDASSVRVGDVLNIRLAQKMALTGVKKIVDANTRFAASSHWTDLGEFAHIIANTAINTWTDANSVVHEVAVRRNPLVFVGGNGTYNGVYHADSIEMSTGPKRKWIKICDQPQDDDEPVYNDYTADEIDETYLSDGFIHIPWPTHKYILIELNDGTMYRAYVDSAVDVVLDEGDGVDKYDPLTRCLTICNETVFSQWNEYDGFEQFNGIGRRLGYVNIIWNIPWSKTGAFFPN